MALAAARFQRAVVAAVLLALPLACLAQPRRLNFASDFFWKGEAAVSASLHERTAERAACQARAIHVDVVVVTGHTDKDEPLPQELSLRRAEAIRDRLVGLGVEQKLLVVIGKGTAEPGPQGIPGAASRTEVNVSGTQRRGGKPEDCGAQWKQQLLTLPPGPALETAHAEVGAGWITPVDAVELAIANQRTDLLSGLVDASRGLRLNPDQRRAAYYAAAAAGDANALRTLADAGIGVADGEPGRAVFLATCAWSRPRPSAGDMLDALRLLLSSGEPANGHPQDRRDALSPLHCMASEGHLGAVDALLRAGADANIYPGRAPALAAGRHPGVVALLLAHGAQPREGSGRTLFHTYRMTRAADVHWLVGLGLGINDQAADGYRTPIVEALTYANPEVLEAMVQAGARLDDGGRPPGLLGYARTNIPARAWLIDQGISPPDWPDFILKEVERGDLSLPVLNAASRRGIPLHYWSERGESTLAIAIRVLAPGVTELLLKSGAATAAVTRPPHGVESALTLAFKRRLAEWPGVCFHCEDDWYEKAVAAINAPGRLADREERRSRIIRLLQAREAFP